MKYLSPRADTSFKKLFGHEHHKELTINFLNSILKLPEDKFIKTIDLKETKQWPNTISGREVIFDVYCTDQNNHHFIIEMQSVNESNFVERSQYYMARALANQLKPKQNYVELIPVIFLGIVDYDLSKIHKNKSESDFRKSSLIALEEFIDQSSDVASHYSLINRKTGKILSVPLMELHFIELPKFNKSIEECRTDEDKWLYFMKNAEECKEIPQEMQDSDKFIEAFEVLNQKNWKSEEFEKYVKDLDAIGREDRIAENNFFYGKLEEKEAVAKNLLKMGLSIEMIVQATGLSIQQIQKIQNK